MNRIKLHEYVLYLWWGNISIFAISKARYSRYSTQLFKNENAAFSAFSEVVIIIKESTAKFVIYKYKWKYVCFKTIFNWVKQLSVKLFLLLNYFKEIFYNGFV